MYVLFDASYLCYRSFHSNSKIGKDGRVTGLCYNGIGTGMAYGTIQTLFYLFTKYKWASNQVAFVWDDKPQWKFDLYPDYKKGRKKENHPPLMSISTQFKMTKLLLGFIGVPWITAVGEESDDILRTVSLKLSQAGQQVYVVGNDHDLYQCLNPLVKLMRLHQNKPEEIYTDAMFSDDYDGTLPEDYAFIQALGGCNTDKVPGMNGIGADPGSDTPKKIVAMNPFNKIRMNDPSLVFPDNRTENAFRKNFDTWNFERDYKLVRCKTDVKYELHKFDFNGEKLREWFVKLAFQHFLLPNHFQRIVEIFS